MILDFTAYWNNQNGLPFTNKSIHVVNLQNTTLAILICGEIVYYVSSTVYADSDIKSVKSSSSRNHTRFLALRVSMFLGSIQKESSEELSIVMERFVLQHAADPVEELLKSGMLLNTTQIPMLTIESNIKVDY